MNIVGVDPIAPEQAVNAAVAWMRAGNVVIIPTDTLYGLAADPTSDSAIELIFDLKGRRGTEPLPLIAASSGQVAAFCGAIPRDVESLARLFWPGPLSLIVDAPARIVEAVHAGRGSIAIRVPAHPVARALCAIWGAPVTATSANRSGRPPAARIGDLDDIAADPRVLVIDAGPLPGGAPSTIVDARTSPPVLIRDGAIAWSRVLECLRARR